MIGLFEEQISILHRFFFQFERVFSTQEFFIFTQELFHFTQEILPLLPKKLPTPYSRNLRVPNHHQSSPGLSDWAISRELGYPKVLFATGFYDGKFANFQATRNFHERILGEQILSFSCLSFCLTKHLVIVILCMSDMVPDSTFFILWF